MGVIELIENEEIGRFDEGGWVGATGKGSNEEKEKPLKDEV